MSRFLVGAGGWAYFRVPDLNPLAAYIRAFNFVEVNSTFYEYPCLKLVESWRRRAPSSFNFSVRCHQDLTHKYKLKPYNEAYETLHKMLTICQILKADILHLQTPPAFKFTKSEIDSIYNFFGSSNLKGVRIAWEIRGIKGKYLDHSLIKLMKDFNIIHCVDISREEPAFESDILYTRLFGRGVHNIYQFTDEELRDIHTKASKEAKYETSAICFHGAKMYKDAARIKIFNETGKFPPVTKSIGLESLKEVLKEDAKFPCTKEQLVKNQGWKVIDLTRNMRTHASAVLHELPEKRYHGIGEVIKALRSKVE